MASSHNSPYNVGDFIINFGQVYQVTDITLKKNPKGQEEPYIYYQSYYAAKPSRVLSGSIPLSNLDKTSQRKPVSKKTIVDLFKTLSNGKASVTKIDISNTDAIFKENDIYKTADLAKALWADKLDETTNFSPNKSDSLEKTLDYLSQEIALVLDITPEKAVEKLTTSLGD